MALSSIARLLCARDLHALLRSTSCAQALFAQGRTVCSSHLHLVEESGKEVAAPDSDATPVEAVAPRRRGKRRTRKEKGSYVDNGDIIRELDEVSPVWPENVPIYDPIREVGWLSEPRSPANERLRQLMRTEEGAAALRAVLQLEDSDKEDSTTPSAEKILEWEVQFVMATGFANEPHPINKKVKCRVYLRDLQRHQELSDLALQHIALICGPRYDPRKGLLTLTSEKYPDRTENQFHIMDILKDLVAEGKRAYPLENMHASEQGELDIQTER